MNTLLLAEVQKALASRKPVVALESTVITHGLPRPENARVGRELEQVARDHGAVPATIAFMDGNSCIGLDDSALDRLAAMENAVKCSLRDIPVVMAKKLCGGVTVAATMHLAHKAGIQVFATGGVGGVHRGQPFDISADISALGHIPITVVCAGAKSILDVPLTLEALETRGVTVIGYQTDEFPIFYSRESGLPVDVRCDDPDEVAAIIKARDTAGLPSAILVVNPVPAADAMPAVEAEFAIKQALSEAESAGVSGKNVTPFLLAKVSELTGERSKSANLALLRNNVRLGAEIAKALL
ncbi:MAG TPA: pseudouridine-5'-phosphate glycosidase [Kiritimatiellia bacterium]|nr:pseudouridine-5'-phosphate glycosidase [Kiritimatiellia bacterium]